MNVVTDEFWVAPITFSPIDSYRGRSKYRNNSTRKLKKLLEKIIDIKLQNTKTIKQRYQG
jgi:hypothetical protein